MRLKTMSPKPLVMALHGASAPLPILAVLLRISRAGNISSSDDAALAQVMMRLSQTGGQFGRCMNARMA
jgi:hypothetical protein